MSITFKGELRDKLGSRTARKLRADGRVPVSIQGQDKPNTNASIELAAFESARRKHESLFDIELGSDTETAMVRELQWDSMGEALVHIEFKRVVRGVEIEAEVEIRFLGQSRSGALQHLHDRLKIRAIPSKLPDAIEISADLVPEDGPLLAKDVKLPEGVTLADAPDLAIAAIAAASAAEPEADAEEEEEGGADEVPTIGGSDE